MNSGDQLAEAYAIRILRWRWLAITAFILAVLLMASGARFLQIRGDCRYNFGENNPQLKAFEEIQAIYSKNDNVLFALVDPGGDVFNPRTLEAVHRLTEAAWQLPYSSRVDSITNFQHSFARGDELIVETLVEDLELLNEPRLISIRQIVLNEPLLNGRLISPDAAATGVNVTVQLPDDTLSHEVEVIKETEALLAKIKKEFPEITFALTGAVALSSTINRLAESDFKNLTLTFSGGSKDGGNFATTNSIDADVWPNSGAWEFQNNDRTKLLRNDNVVMSISVTQTTLRTSFTVSGGLKEGNWVFDFIKQ